jgi:hypothetical protein
MAVDGPVPTPPHAELTGTFGRAIVAVGWNVAGQLRPGDQIGRRKTARAARWSNAWRGGGLGLRRATSEVRQDGATSFSVTRETTVRRRIVYSKDRRRSNEIWYDATA